MFLEGSTREPVFLPVTAPPGIDPTAYPCQAILVPEPAQAPARTDPGWLAGTWAPGPEISVTIDAATYLPGHYMMFGKIQAGNAEPVLRGGRVRIGDAAG